MDNYQKSDVPKRLLRIFLGEDKKYNHPKKLLAEPDAFIKYVLSDIADVEGAVKKKTAASYAAITELLAQIMASAGDDASELVPRKAVHFRQNIAAYTATNLIVIWIDYDDPEPTPQGIKDRWNDSACKAALENMADEFEEYIEAWARYQACSVKNPLDELFGGTACSAERSTMNVEWHDVEVAQQMMETACTHDFFG